MRRAAWMAGAILLLVALAWLLRSDPWAPHRAHEPPPLASEEAPPAAARPGTSAGAQERRITVHVRGPDDAPRPGALVRVLDANGAEVARGDTNRGGVAHLRVRGAGSVVVSRVQPLYPVRVPLGPGSEQVTLRPAAGELSISGRVLDTDGTPVEATVAAKWADAPDWAGAWLWTGRAVPRQGGFRIEGLRPGRHALFVQSRNTHGVPPREPVVAEAGRDDVVIRLRKVAWLTFRWTDALTREPIATRRRVEWTEAGRPMASTSEGPPSGDPPSRLAVEPGAALLFHAEADGYTRSSLPIKLRPGEDAREVEFRLRPDPDALVEVELVLRDSGGDPVREITIMRVPGGGTVHRTDDGRVVLALPAGRNRLRFGPLIRGRRHGPWVVRFLDLDLARAERRTVPVEIQRGGWVRRPAGALGARVLGSDENFVLFAPGDARICLPPGRHTVVADREDGTRLRGEVEVAADKLSDVALRPVGD